METKINSIGRVLGSLACNGVLQRGSSHRLRIVGQTQPFLARRRSRDDGWMSSRDGPDDKLQVGKIEGSMYYV